MGAADTVGRGMLSVSLGVLWTGAWPNVAVFLRCLGSLVTFGFGLMSIVGWMSIMSVHIRSSVLVSVVRGVSIIGGSPKEHLREV